MASQVIKILNERMAEVCEKYPTALWPSLRWPRQQFPDLATRQLEEGIKKYNLSGVAIAGHVNGDEMSSAKFDPFWKKAEGLGCLIFMHPLEIPELSKRFEGRRPGQRDRPSSETTIFLSHLIFDGTLDRFPGLKIRRPMPAAICLSYKGRFDAACTRREPARTPKTRVGILAAMYFDTIVFTTEGLRHLVAECGASQIMIGTDYPYA